MASERECPPSKSEEHEKNPSVGKEDSSSLPAILPNPHLVKMESDYLYHLGYSKEECVKLFGDVKFVVTGGSNNRLEKFADLIAEKLNFPPETVEKLTRTDRFAFFKIGPVISISHGMGVPSITIMLHEMIKLLRYAGAVDPVILRMGTSGGVGVDPGTVVVTNKAFNAFLEEKHEVVVLGKRDLRDATMNQELVQEIFSHSREGDGYRTVLGGTMCTDDFYEGQARLDGVTCQHSEEEKMLYLHKLREKGVCNIEMECTALASLCHATKVKCAVVCVALLNRLNGDQVDIPPEVYKEYQLRSQELICRFISARLNGNNSNPDI